MKLGILAVVICFGFPIGLFFLMGPEAFNDGVVVTSTMAVGAVIFLMGCLCTIKNLLSWFFDFLLISLGAFLLLIAAFARPLGLYDGEATSVESMFESVHEVDTEGNVGQDAHSESLE